MKPGDCGLINNTESGETLHKPLASLRERDTGGGRAVQWNPGLVLAHNSQSSRDVGAKLYKTTHAHPLDEHQFFSYPVLFKSDGLKIPECRPKSSNGF
jgi:hypothetical protein